VTRRLCTVLIPFDAPGQVRFAILAAVGEELGLQTMRVAQYYSSGMILEEIVRSIRDAHLIIADLTGGNPNVYYELGIAHALGKRVFLTSEDPQACPIDFGSLAVCRFEATEAGRDRLQRELRSFLDTPGTLSPIDIFTGGLAVAGQPLLARRAVALVLDLLILAPALGVLVVLIPKAYYGAAIAPGMLIYFVAASVLLGTTPGQRIVRLRVTQLDRSRPSPRQRFLRPVAAVLNVISLGGGFLWAARSPRHQAVHDIITRTLVLRRSAVEPVRIEAPAAAK
jgi:uncharacterized RDD family membrane protein YckC